MKIIQNSQKRLATRVTQYDNSSPMRKLLLTCLALPLGWLSTTSAQNMDEALLVAINAERGKLGVTPLVKDVGYDVKGRAWDNIWNYWWGPKGVWQRTGWGWNWNETYRIPAIGISPRVVKIVRFYSDNYSSKNRSYKSVAEIVTFLKASPEFRPIFDNSTKLFASASAINESRGTQQIMLCAYGISRVGDPVMTTEQKGIDPYNSFGVPLGQRYRLQLAPRNETIVAHSRYPRGARLTAGNRLIGRASTTRRKYKIVVETDARIYLTTLNVSAEYRYSRPPLQR